MGVDCAGVGVDCFTSDVFSSVASSGFVGPVPGFFVGLSSGFFSGSGVGLGVGVAVGLGVGVGVGLGVSVGLGVGVAVGFGVVVGVTSGAGVFVGLGVSVDLGGSVYLGGVGFDFLPTLYFQVPPSSKLLNANESNSSELTPASLQATTKAFLLDVNGSPLSSKKVIRKSGL